MNSMIQSLSTFYTSKTLSYQTDLADLSNSANSRCSRVASLVSLVANYLFAKLLGFVLFLAEMIAPTPVSRQISPPSHPQVPPATSPPASPPPSPPSPQSQPSASPHGSLPPSPASAAPSSSQISASSSASAGSSSTGGPSTWTVLCGSESQYSQGLNSACPVAACLFAASEEDAETFLKNCFNKLLPLKESGKLLSDPTKHPYMDEAVNAVKELLPNAPIVCEKWPTSDFSEMPEDCPFSFPYNDLEMHLARFLDMEDAYGLSLNISGTSFALRKQDGFLELFDSHGQTQSLLQEGVNVPAINKAFVVRIPLAEAKENLSILKNISQNLATQSFGDYSTNIIQSFCYERPQQLPASNPNHSTLFPAPESPSSSSGTAASASSAAQASSPTPPFSSHYSASSSSPWSPYGPNNANTFTVSAFLAFATALLDHPSPYLLPNDNSTRPSSSSSSSAAPYTPLRVSRTLLADNARQLAATDLPGNAEDTLYFEWSNIAPGPYSNTPFITTLNAIYPDSGRRAFLIDDLGTNLLGFAEDENAGTLFLRIRTSELIIKKKENKITLDYKDTQGKPIQKEYLARTQIESLKKNILGLVRPQLQTRNIQRPVVFSTCYQRSKTT